MIFNELAYFALIALSALAFRWLPPRLKPWWLFASGVLFYAYFSPAFVVILMVELAAVWVLGGFVRRGGTRARLAFAAGLAVCLGALFLYKYAGLVSRTVGAVGVESLPTFETLRLPLAISFFTFEFVHYLVDARRGTLPDHATEDFLGFALFVPTMVAGPIKRFQGFWGQVRVARADAEDVNAGVTRILTGLVKKIVLADTLTLWITPLASTDGLYSASRMEIVVALVAYAFRIYFDFSGYSDIAIGSARLFGVRVPENFDWPYLKTDIAAFWRSWHMSLTSWIRDYVYIPLGGSRCSLPRQCLNLLAAFAISGLWHGAAWNFLGWGLYHGALLAGHRVYTVKLKPLLPMPAEDARVLRGAGMLASGVFTFALVTLGWGLFAMPFARFVEMLRMLVGGGL